ncbi:MAG TPA: HlyD family type I secretion periplasmic adaptor subunit [Caulobacteraceae bacterium]|jgi:HlyD family type I secretion membrane fusion protein|nr:HlyD family type I secretion periplasmic adaptor subunit [Caulobacteraceae bacterium]
MILYVLAGMVGLSILLMCVVKLDRLVSGRGRILPVAGSLFVRPLDRAIVSRILVRSGDVVRKGQPLAILDPTFASADLSQLVDKRASSAALVARLRAEAAGRPYVAAAGDAAASLQQALWRERQAEFGKSLADFDARIRADEADIQTAQQDAQGYRRRSELAADIQAGQETLQQKGFGSHVRLIAATEDRVEAERLAASSQSQTAKAQHDLAALRAQRAVFVSKWRDDISTDLAKAQDELAELTQNAAKAEKVSELSTLTAPADAVVVDIGKASTGTVIDPTSAGGPALFTLTPLSGPLEGEIEVAPKDVGFIRRGDKVRIKLDPYRYTSHGAAAGVIETISDDAFTVGENGQVRAPYYKVRVALTDTRLRNVPAGFRLIPGMTLEGDVKVGSRTMMSYLLEGALRTGSEAMREP